MGIQAETFFDNFGLDYNWGAGEGWSRVGQVREWRHVVRFDGVYRILRSASLHGLHLYKFSSSFFFFLNLLLPFRNGPPNEDFVIYVIIIQQL